MSAVWVALAEPTLAAGSFVLLTHWLSPPVVRADLALVLLILALTFPAPSRLQQNRLQAYIEFILQWLQLLLVLVLCGWATRSLALYDSWVVGIWAGLTPAVLMIHHEISRALIHWQVRHMSQLQRALVIGSGSLAIRTARALRRQRRALQMDFLGWVSEAYGRSQTMAKKISPRRIGQVQDIAQIVQNNHVQHVYIALEGACEIQVRTLLEDLQNTSAAVYIVPDVLHALVVQGQLQTLDGLPIVAVRTWPFTGVRAAVKRASDLLLSTLILLLIWPLLLVIAVAIKFETPGPALFRQNRMGLDGQSFEVWKFRTMYHAVASFDPKGLQQASRNDRRITPLGAFLRRTSLDELPQFINVIQGRMSIVGPRPHALVHHEQYRPLVQAYMVRHTVRPGITGWAQVHGFRGETDTLDKMRRRIEHDLFYLQHWSLALDAQIILRTIGLIFKDAHAW